MENTPADEEIQEAIEEMQKELIEDLKLGQFYGLDQKIRNIQKMLNLSIRV